MRYQVQWQGRMQNLSAFHEMQTCTVPQLRIRVPGVKRMIKKTNESFLNDKKLK